MALPNQFGDSPKLNDERQERGGDWTDLAAWCMEKVRYGREVRDQKYGRRWEEYTRMARGFWTDADKNTQSERSRLIAPALSQAVDMTVSEMEEATFNKTAWFDIEDDIADEQRDDAIAYRDQLLEDFTLDSIPAAVSQVYWLGAVYGTGIGKINVGKKKEYTVVQGVRQRKDRFSVWLECIRPDEFVIDPSALDVNEALFCAHEMVRPIHSVRQKQASGAYRKVHVAPYSGQKASTDGTKKHTNVEARDGGVLVTEYYGLVPTRMLPGGAQDGEAGMVEAIVTIANEGILLKAVKSPYTMRDRPIIAYQHERIPGEFWGRGVCEKGYNPQKALDAELRARIDALALITAPMMGADITRLPRNPDMTVRPGKTVFTRGRPSEILEPVSFGSPQVLANTFQQAGDLERMVQMATGAMDSATPLSTARRNETASGMSMMNSGFIKRSKRTMQNVERQFLAPLVRKALWRYMQFDPQRYPYDMKFLVNSTMGIMAKEVENAQLINMLGFVPQESPAHSIIVKAIFDNTASANKKELNEAITEMMRPPSEEQQQKQQQIEELQLRLELAKVSKEEAQARKFAAEAELALARAEHERVEADLEDDLVEIQAANASTAAEKARVQRLQTEVAAERNEVEAMKARNQRKGDTD